MVGGSIFGALVKSTRPDLGVSSIGSVDWKREPKREKTVLVSSTPPPSAWPATVMSDISPASNSNGNSSVLAIPLGALGVAVKRSSDKETEGRPPTPGLSSF